MPSVSPIGEHKEQIWSVIKMYISCADRAGVIVVSLEAISAVGRSLIHMSP